MTRLSILGAVAVLFAMPAAAGTSRSENPDLRNHNFWDGRLHFEPNVGQADGRIRFVARGRGYGLYVTPTETALALGRNGGGAAEIVRLRLLGANPQPVIEGQDRLRGHSNYFIGSDPTKWHRAVPHYGSVVVEQIYPGISLAYHGNPRELEYDFLVSPGADPGRIRLAFDGIAGRRLDRAGNLVLALATGQLLQKAPVAYQDVAGVRKTVESRYELKGTNEVRIVLGPYDKARTLVIDPPLHYATYLGGSGLDEPRAVALDGQGKVYVTGFTGFPDAAPFPTTPGAFQTVYGGNNHDVFISKLDPAGQGAADLVYSTYLGGTGDDLGWGIAADSQGAAYVVGETTAAGSDFPTTPGAFQTSSIGGWDAFMVKLDPSGGLAYSTYLGGGDIDEAKGVTLDPSGVVYVTGQSRSTAATGAFPTTAGAYQIVNAGDYDGFVVKLNPQGGGTADLLYSTLFGGATQDLPQQVKLHGSTIYIAGYSTGSGTLPTTPGAYQALNAGEPDAFLAVFNPAGSGQADLVYATYLGGNRLDVCFGLAVDASGMAYLGGYTEGDSPNSFPTTVGAYQPSYGGIQDAFAAKINPAGGGLSDLVYSTYVGGFSTDSALDLTIDEAGTIFLTGHAGNGYPTTPGAYQPANAGDADVFMTRLDPAGGGAADLLYSTYFGGPDLDNAYAIAVDADGVMNVAGSTLGVIPTTAGAFQTTNAGSYDVFLASLAPVAVPPPPPPPPPPPHFLYLHGSGSLANPSILFLDDTAPSASSPRFRDSNALHFSGGNKWKPIGTWPATPSMTQGTIFFTSLDAWVGLKKSGDEGTNFDLRAELFRNGVLFDSRELLCIQGLGSDPNGATEVSLSLLPAGAVFDGSTDVLSVRLSTRIGTAGGGQFCGGGPSHAAGLRVYFDAVSRPTVLSYTQP